MWAIWQPVTKANDAVDGSPRSSVTHVPAISSTTAAVGVGSSSPAFWSHAETSQSAASAAGSVPPITKPKNRPDPIAVRPGSPSRASPSITSRSGAPVSGRGPPSASRSSAIDAVGAIGRSADETNHSVPSSAARRRTSCSSIARVYDAARSARRASAVTAARARTTSQTGSIRGSSADGIAQSTHPRFTSCSFHASWARLTAP